MDFHVVVLRILVLCVTNLYSQKSTNNGISLYDRLRLSGIPLNKHNFLSVDENPNGYSSRKIYSESNTRTSLPSTISAKELSYITQKLENLLRNVLLSQSNNNDDRRVLKTNINGQTFNPQYQINTNIPYSIADLKNKAEQVAVLKRVQQFEDILTEQSKQLLQNPPIDSIKVDSSSTLVATNFSDGIPQVTLTPAELHILLKNLHVLNKRNVGFQQSNRPSNLYPVFDNGDSMTYNGNLKTYQRNPYQHQFDTNPDPAVIKYIVSPAIQHNLLYSHMPSDIHLVPPNHHQYTRTRSRDTDRCSPGSQWTMSCKECTCHDDKQVICVKMSNCGLRQLVTNCTPLTKFALNLCTECTCDINAMPRCYSICNGGHKETSGGAPKIRGRENKT